MKPHGTFSIQRQDRALLIEIIGSWNLEGYLDFVKAFRAAALPLVDQPWGAIVDINEWGLSTPEVNDANEELQLWTMKNNQKWRAFISDKNILKEEQVESSAAVVFGAVETRFFPSNAEANAWFVELGLLRSESGKHL
ncbi:MAG: hypothetical protein ACSHXK_07500 [Oceanococcus sp.]